LPNILDFRLNLGHSAPQSPELSSPVEKALHAEREQHSDHGTDQTNRNRHDNRMRPCCYR